jgi:hypothetical protein
MNFQALNCWAILTAALSAFLLYSGQRGISHGRAARDGRYPRCLAIVVEVVGPSPGRWIILRIDSRHYCSRRAEVGSSEAAREAGNQAANIPITRKQSAMAA